MSVLIRQALPVNPTLDFTWKLRQESLWPRVRAYVLYHREVLEALAKGRVPPLAPEEVSLVSLNLDPTTTCNYRCGHCIDFDALNSPIKHDHQKLLASLDLLITRGLRSVILIGGGEPTVYPGFVDLVLFLKARGIQIGVVTNGSRNHVIHEVAGKFTARDWVRFSLDAGTDKTFQEMHRPAKAITLQEILSWVPRIRARNSELSIGFSFIVTWEGSTQDSKKAGTVPIVSNIDEIVTAARLARDAGCGYISIKPYLTRFPDGAEVMNTSAIEDFVATIARIRANVDEAKLLETETFQVRPSANLRALEDGSWKDFTKQPVVCHANRFRSVLSPLGIFSCPAHRGVEAARIANADGYHNEEAARNTVAALGANQLAFNAHEKCRNITCIYNLLNWWIEKLITGEIDLASVEVVPDRGDFFL